jgi:hypothetical protein
MLTLHMRAVADVKHAAHSAMHEACRMNCQRIIEPAKRVQGGPSSDKVIVSWCAVGAVGAVLGRARSACAGEAQHHVRLVSQAGRRARACTRHVAPCGQRKKHCGSSPPTLLCCGVTWASLHVGGTTLLAVQRDPTLLRRQDHIRRLWQQ